MILLFFGPSGVQDIQYDEVKEFMISVIRSLTAAECQDLGCMLIVEAYKKQVQ